MKINDLELKWLGHSGFLIKTPTPQAYPDKSFTKISTKGKIIYIDPFQIKNDLPKADLILLTHSHYDHCSIEDIEKIIQPGTKIICPADCQSKIMHFDVPIKIEIIEPGQEIDFLNIKILGFPAYNIDKTFHPKEEQWLGYLIKTENVLIYHAGDTDVIPEMQNLTGYKQADKKLILLLPVGGRFTMTAEEAFEVVKMIKPDLAIPMHYGSIVGTKEDAEEFKELCEEEGIRCQIMEKN